MKSLIKFLLGLILLVHCQALFSADWFAYVPNNATNTLVPINLTTNTTQTSINLGGLGASNIAITPDGLKAYVTNNFSNDVTLVDLVTNATTLISVGTSPLGVAVTPDGQTVYVTNNGSHNLTLIDVATNSTTDIDLGLDNSPFGIAITPDGTRAYIAILDGAGTLANSVAILDITSSTIIGSIPTPNPFYLAITPNGTKAYVANFFDNFVTPIDIINDIALPVIPVGSFPFYVAITANGNTAFVTNEGDSTISPIDVATDVAGAPIPLDNPPFGNAPFGIAITPDSQTGYVSNFGSDDVTPFSTITQMIAAAIPMDAGNNGPFGIAISPDQAPTAAFVSTPAPVGSPTSFDASASTSPVGTVAVYAWDFGDGNMATVFTPFIDHIYNSAGNFIVTLTVTNSAGTSTTQTFTGQTVSNNGGPSARLSQPITISSAVSPPLPPSNFFGVVIKSRCPTKHGCFLIARWNASPTENVALYRIYNNGMLVETISASSPLIYSTCLESCSSSGFEIAAVNIDNIESVRVKIKRVNAPI